MTTATVSPMTTVWKQASRIYPEVKERREWFGEADLFRVVGQFCGDTRIDWQMNSQALCGWLGRGAGRGQRPGEGM